MGFFITKEDKEDKISAFLYSIYDDALYKTKDKGEKEFESNLRKIVNEFLEKRRNKRLNDFIKNDEELKKFYEDQIKKKIEKYNEDKDRFKNENDYLKLKNDINKQNDFEEIMNIEFNNAKISDNVEEFKAYYENYTNLENLKQVYDKIKTNFPNNNKSEIKQLNEEDINKIEKSYKFLEKFKILNIKYEKFKNCNFKEDELNSDYNSFIKVYENLKIINEYKKIYEEKYKSIIKNNITSYRTEHADIKDEIDKIINENYNQAIKSSSTDEKFKEFYDKIDKIKYYKDNFPLWFEDCFETKFKQFQILNMERKIDKEFLNAQTNAQGNKDTFLRHFKSIPSIKMYSEMYNSHYDNYIQIKVENFEQNLIKTKINKNFKKAKEEKDEENFKKFYDNLEELKDLKEKYNNIYTEYLDEKLKEYKDYKNNKSQKDQEIKQNIKDFVNTNYEQISSNSIDFSVDTFEKKYENEIEKNSDLKDKIKNTYKSFFDDLMKEKKKLFKKNSIQLFYNQIYDGVYSSSLNEETFMVNIKQKFDENENLKNYLIENDCKNYLDTIISKDKENRKIMFHMRNTHDKEELEKFFIEKSYTILNDCKEKKENEFKIEFKKQLPDSLKNSLIIDDFLDNKTPIFIKQQEFEQKQLECINKFLGDIKDYNDDNVLKDFEGFLDNIDETLELFFSKAFFIDLLSRKIKAFIRDILTNTNVLDAKVEHLNIILCGCTGKGKSTLINALLKLEGSERCETDDFRPCTMTITEKQSNRFPIFKLIDTRGMDNNYSFLQLKTEILNEIDKRFNGKEAGKFVHCIWYIINTFDTRLQESEIQFLREIGDKYKMDKLPVIIVGTRAILPTYNTKWKNHIDETVKLPFSVLLAEPDADVNPFGIEELKLLTIEQASNAVESSCFTGIIENVKNTSNEKIDSLKETVKHEFKNKLTEIIENKSDFIKEMKDIFIEILKRCFLALSNNLNNEQIVIENEDDQNLNNFISNYKNNCNQYR